MTKSTATTIVLALVLLATPALADTAPPSTPRTAHLEIAQTSAGAKKSTKARVSVALVANAAPSVVSAKLGNAFYKLNVRQFDQGGVPLVTLHVEGSGPNDVAIIDLSATTRMRPGKRAVLGRVDGTDGRTFEIALTVK